MNLNNEIVLQIGWYEGLGGMGLGLVEYSQAAINIYMDQFYWPVNSQGGKSRQLGGP